MNTDRLKVAKNVTLATGMLSCGLLSWFFTMVGYNINKFLSESPDHAASLGSMLFTLPSLWGIIWGLYCGKKGTDLLVQRLLQKRSILDGLWIGLLVGLVVGGVNGALTATLPVGLFLGFCLGPMAGLILAFLFSAIYRDGNA